MWQRIQTAIILVSIVGIAMFAFKSPYPFVCLLMLGAVIGCYEWQKLLPRQSTASFALLLSLVFFLAVLSMVFNSIKIGLWGLAWLIWIQAIVWIGQFPNKTGWHQQTKLMVLGIVILASALTSMYYLWSLSPWWLLYVFVLVWCADSGAYFVGRKFGRKKMSPKVSPNKSMEGLYGGLCTGLIAVLLVSFIVLKYPTIQLLYFLVLSGITIIASVFGDLFESMLKRQADIKDSGSILPGHGGVLDRIDSLLAATPIFALGYWLMSLYFNS